MTMDMIVRKKALKIQERLGMNIGVAGGVSSIPTVRTSDQAMNALRELYKIGFRAFLLPRELFSGILTSTDLYKNYYGELLRIKELAKKLNIELSIQHPNLSDMPDEDLKTFCSIMSIMDARTFIIRPNFYRMMPQDQALRLVVHKINEIMMGLRTRARIGIETTGTIGELGSLDEMIEIVKRTHGTEPIINWGNIHARGSGGLRTEEDYRKVLDKVRWDVGSSWIQNAYFIFSGVSYGPSGKIKEIPLRRSDMNLKYMIKGAMSLGIKGTLILDDPSKEKVVLDMLEDIADMVR
jgi:hypothetical protein